MYYQGFLIIKSNALYLMKVLQYLLGIIGREEFNDKKNKKNK